LHPFTRAKAESLELHEAGKRKKENGGLQGLQLGSKEHPWRGGGDGDAEGRRRAGGELMASVYATFSHP